MKILLVGDVHAQIECLEDCSRLIDFVASTLEANHVKRVVFLGDQYHTHSIVRVEVMRFWQEAFARLSSKFEVVALVGNHDRSMVSDAHAMLAHKDQITVVDEPTVIDNALYLPYMSNDDFVSACNRHKDVDVVFCHQTFDGSTYESGFFAPDGVSPDLIPQSIVYSGHIHTHQTVAGGKVRYPGSPRWATLNDANLEKIISIVDPSDDTVEAFYTKHVCTPIYHLTEIQDMLIDTLPRGVVTIDLKGPSEWIQERVGFWRGRAKLRTFPIDAKTVTVKESDGIGVAFGKFIESYCPKYSTDKRVLEEMANVRLSV